MSENWRLKRTNQCKKCPWKKSTNAYEIPNDYSVENHKALKSTIATDPFSTINGPISVMACHESNKAHCIGWLHNQLGEGNNIGMRIRMASCSNPKYHIEGEQHDTLEQTIPD